MLTIAAFLVLGGAISKSANPFLPVYILMEAPAMTRIQYASMVKAGIFCRFIVIFSVAPII